ncbi:hypothetical protein SAMN05444413_1243 [Roseivivax marinus]|uniref:hypothetical protein n=1 Tax=Roseivivax marinus TaxID=1379903 RepID=UPI0008C54675|nr:hypothetical protein [Roseivivax marinus]SEL93955.1 hypothetical protein SAMN05444413_1243 [Roseivivax marinus]
MGGLGSGNYWRWDARPTTDAYRRLDVRRWARDGLLRPGSRFGWQWRRDGETLASINAEVSHGFVTLDYRARDGGDDWQPMRYDVHLDATPCHLGGTRRWFLCPARGCGKRVAVLYGGKVFACRRCYGLAYPSQNENHADRAARRADRIRDRLGWEPGILNGSGTKPTGMHWRTFERLVAEHDEWCIMSCAMMLERLATQTSAAPHLSAIP